MWNFAFAALFPPLYCAALKMAIKRYPFVRGWIWSACGCLAGAQFDPHRLAETLGAGLSLLVAVAVWLWRRYRDKRKRAAAWLGAKSRALIERLAQNMPEPRRLAGQGA